MAYRPNNQEISPFFQSLNQSIDQIVPLAMEKYKLDQQNTQWESNLKELQRGHNINLLTNLAKQYHETGDPETANAMNTLMSSVGGEQNPGLKLGTTLPPAISAARERLARLKQFQESEQTGVRITPEDRERWDFSSYTPEDLARGMRLRTPEETLKNKISFMPEDVDRDAQSLYQLAHAKSLPEMADLKRQLGLAALDLKGQQIQNALTIASLKQVGRTPAQIQVYEYFKKEYGDDFAQRMLTKVKDPSEGQVWNRTYQTSIGNYEAPELAEQRADKAVNEYRRRFGENKMGSRSISSAVDYLKQAGKDKGDALERIRALAKQGWSREELDQISKNAGW